MPSITEDQREKWGDVSPARAAELDRQESQAQTRWFYSRQGGGTFATNWAELNPDQRELFLDRCKRGELIVASGPDDKPDLPEDVVDGRVARNPAMQDAGSPMAPRQGVDPFAAGLDGGQELSDDASREVAAEFDAMKDVTRETPGEEVARLKQGAGVEARVEESSSGVRETARGRSAAKRTTARQESGS